MAADNGLARSRQSAPVIWSPSRKRVERARLTRYLR